ncbi:MAG: undecaprenyl-phosphate glucose phosphotransferase [Bacillota bacterium]|nr:undecaprenyl-phosphate glucose phosphotransferase [Bacillota bacterium]
MVRGKERFLTKLYVGIDFLFIQAAFFVAWFFRFALVGVQEGSHLPLVNYYFWNLNYSVTYIMIAFIISLYAPKRKNKFSLEVAKLFQAHLFSMFILLSVLFVVKNVNISRLFLILYFILSLVFVILYRYVVKQGLRNLRSKGYNKQFILILGAGSLGKEYFNNLVKHPEYGLEVIGFLDDNRVGNVGSEKINRPILGKLVNLKQILSEKIIDEVVIALPLKLFPKYKEIIKVCEKTGLRVSIIPDFHDILPTTPYFERFGDLPLINVRDVPLDEFVNRIFKRAFDIAFSIIVLIVLSPLFLFIAIGVKVSSSGPIFFKQERVGLNRRPFYMYKFRSMRHVQEHISNTKWTVENDPRRTKFGTFIRMTSLDELPQFFNVLKGDMSVVGPRPERPFFVEQFKEEVPKYMMKHQVRPGITGWAQVSGFRGDTSIKGRIDHDIYYIENWTFQFDIKIILMTMTNGLTNKNAY